MIDAKTVEQALKEARSCRLCKLQHEPRPLLRLTISARLLIIGQAPGRRAHETGLPWNDPSGDRLRTWLGLDRGSFYNDKRIAILPMGLCYPGRSLQGADLPPRRECAPLWQSLSQLLPDLTLTLLIGSYAQAYHLKQRGTQWTKMTDIVRSWRQLGPYIIPLPHPSWRNNAWLKKHGWFEEDLLPVLKKRVKDLLS